MDRIRPWLYIGKYRHTLNRRLLLAHKIQAVLQLAAWVPYPDLPALFLPVEDFAPIPPELLRQGVDFILTHKRQDHIVFVACGAGINRSTAFCVAALKEEEGLGLLEAFQAVKKNHSHAMPHPPVWASLCDYYGDHVPFDTLYAWP
jgi:hypothetical protein